MSCLPHLVPQSRLTEPFLTACVGKHLPQGTFLPSHYAVSLNFSRSNLNTNDSAVTRFSGDVGIDFTSTVDTSCVVLNAVHINVTNVRIRTEGDIDTQLCANNASCSAIIR